MVTPVVAPTVVALGISQGALGTSQVPLGISQVPLGISQVPLGISQVALGTSLPESGGVQWEKLLLCKLCSTIFFTKNHWCHHRCHQWCDLPAKNEH